MTSLLEQLPEIVADGKRDAERIMERLESKEREQGDNTATTPRRAKCLILQSF